MDIEEKLLILKQMIKNDYREITILSFIDGILADWKDHLLEDKEADTYCD